MDCGGDVRLEWKWELAVGEGGGKDEGCFRALGEGLVLAAS